MKIMTILLLVLVFLYADKSSEGKKDNYFPQIIDIEKTFTVRLNESICLPCKVRRQRPCRKHKCLIFWMKDGSVVNGRLPRYRKRANNCLKIRNIRSSDHAKFTCTAVSSNDQNFRSVAVRNLIVINRDVNATQLPEPEPSTKFKPSVPVPLFFRDTLKRTARLIRKFFFIGRKAKLKCAISGSPTPQIKWYFNGELLNGRKSFNIRSKSFALVINKFTPYHIGNYTCVGSNGRGIINMSFIVSNKSGVASPPVPVELEKIVKEGDNITLHCKKPAKQVKWVKWHVPKAELRKQQQSKGLLRDYRPFSYLAKKEKLNNNGSATDVLYLYNITEQTHGGKYKCVALFKSRKRLYDVKIVELKFQTNTEIVVVQTGSPNSEFLLVKIAVPVMGSLLTLIVVIICFRCSRKTTVNNPARPRADEEENTLSMHILPNTPTGTLRIHKSLQDFVENNRKVPGDNMSNITNRNITEDNKNNCRTTSDNTQCVKNSLSQNSLKPSMNSNHNATSTKAVSNGSCYSIPDSCSSKKYSSSNENIDYFTSEKELENSKIHANNIETNKECCHNRRHPPKQRVKQNDTYTDCGNTYPYSSRSIAVVDNVSSTDIPDLSEEDDQLLQREMKNWESLIRDSTSYISERNKSDDESPSPPKYNVMSSEDTVLLSQPSNDSGLSSPSDCTKHIII